MLQCRLQIGHILSGHQKLRVGGCMEEELLIQLEGKYDILAAEEVSIIDTCPQVSMRFSYLVLTN